MRVSFIFGLDPDGVGGIESSSMAIADIGGLVASGEGTAAGNPKALMEGPRLKPRFGRLLLGGGGLVAELEGVAGAVPLLNSAHRGHLRLVSEVKGQQKNGTTQICEEHTHMTHLATMATSPLS